MVAYWFTGYCSAAANSDLCSGWGAWLSNSTLGIMTWNRSSTIPSCVQGVCFCCSSFDLVQKGPGVHSWRSLAGPHLPCFGSRCTAVSKCKSFRFLLNETKPEELYLLTGIWAMELTLENKIPETGTERVLGWTVPPTALLCRSAGLASSSGDRAVARSNNTLHPSAAVQWVKTIWNVHGTYS